MSKFTKYLIDIFYTVLLEMLLHISLTVSIIYYFDNNTLKKGREGKEEWDDMWVFKFIRENLKFFGL